MLIYTSVYMINIIIAYFSELYKKKNKTFSIYLMYIYTSFFLGFNYLNGIDWWFYQRDYYRDLSINLSKAKGSELLYSLLSSIFKNLNLNYEIYQYIILSFCLYILYEFINNSTQFSLICISLLFAESVLFNYFEPLFRQLLAITFFLLGLRNINSFKYYIYIIIATLFHTSAVVLFLIPIFKKSKSYNFRKGVIIFISIFLAQYSLSFVIKILGRIQIFKHYLNYFSTNYMEQGNFFRIFLVLILLIPLYFLDKNKKIIIKYEKNYHLFYKMAWIYVYIKLILIMYPIFYRFLFYVDLFYYLCVSFLFHLNKAKKTRFILFLVLIIINFSLMYKKLNSYNSKDKERFFPYTNYVVLRSQNKTFSNHLVKIKYRFRKIRGNGN